MVAIPSIQHKAARDLLARENCRGDLMTARHRLSKLLLRQGIVYSCGRARTGKHELWLRNHRFNTAGLELAYDAAFDAMPSTLGRWDRLDRAIATMAADSVLTPVVTRLGSGRRGPHRPCANTPRRAVGPARLRHRAADQRYCRPSDHVRGGSSRRAPGAAAQLTGAPPAYGPRDGRARRPHAG